MNAPEIGDVVPYSYLWAHEHEAGEESGRKTRPCVVVVAIQREGDGLRVAVAPITSSAPGAERVAIELPSALKSALSLDAPRSWVLCDEINQFEWPGYDMGRTPTGGAKYGRIPASLLQRIRVELVNAGKRGAFKITGRD